jgi:hypothetical protein
MHLHHYLRMSLVPLSGILFVLSGCGDGLRQANSGNFSGVLARRADRSVAPSGAAIASISASPVQVIGGSSTKITVSLTGPAPSGGATVQLTTSLANVLELPAAAQIAAGQSIWTRSVSTVPVTSLKVIGISAAYGGRLAGTSVSVAPAATPNFSVVLQPSTLSIVSGQTADTMMITKVSGGFDQALLLSAINVPSGISVKLTPNTISAPGAGDAQAAITVSSAVVPGTYSLRLRASDKTVSHGSTLTLNVTSSTGSGVQFQGCWYKNNGNSYQGVRFSVDSPGTYPFDAVLYYGPSCGASNWADEFGFGTPLSLGAYDYIFWFSDFANRSNMSAIWHVGNSSSQCVNYATVPDC